MITSSLWRRTLAVLTSLGGLSLLFSTPPTWVGICVLIGLASAFYELGKASASVP